MKRLAVLIQAPLSDSDYLDGVKVFYCTFD